MVTASQLQAASVNNYRYAMSNSDYRALANEQNTQQQRGVALTSEEQYRQRKGISTEKTPQQQAAQIRAAQGSQQAQNAQATAANTGVAANASINSTSGLPNGSSFKYTMSHAQQNQFVRENQTLKSQGKAQWTELSFRQAKGINTETASGKYIAPRVTNNSYSSANAGNGSSVVKVRPDTGQNYNTPASYGSGDAKLAQQPKVNPNNSVSVVSASVMQKRREQDASRKTAEAARARNEAQKAADAQRAAFEEAQARERTAQAARAEAKRIASVEARARADQRAKNLQKAANEAKERAKLAEKAASATAKYANTIGEISHYTNAALATGNKFSYQKAANVSRGLQATRDAAQKASDKAERAGVTSHEGQVLLRDGTWMNQVEKKGPKSTKESVKITTEAALAKKRADAKIAAAEARKIEAAYKNVTDKTKKIIDAIQVNGKFGTGAQGVRVVRKDKEGNITAASRTAGTYKSELAAAKKNALIPIVASTKPAERKAIQDARNYLLERMTGKDALTASAGFVAIDEKITFSTKSKSSFKTVDQLRQEKIIARGGLGATSVKMNQKFQETFSYGNVKKVWNEKTGKWNTKAAKAIDLPGLREIEKTRNAAFARVGLEDERMRGQDAIYGNKYGKASMDLLTGTYDNVRTKPVTSAAKVAALYASGVAAGAVIEGGLGAVAAGAGKVATKAASPIIKKGASIASKGIQPAARVALVGGVLYDGGKAVVSGDAVKTVDFVASLAVGGAFGGTGYSKGAKIAKDPISILPGVRTVKLQEVTPGASTAVKDIKIGESFSMFGKPVISKTYEGKVVKGVPTLSKDRYNSLRRQKTLGAKDAETRERLEPVIQTFEKADTHAFIKTLESVSGKTDAETFKAGKIIANVAYAQKKPIVLPKVFEILSKDIPDRIKPVVVSTISSFGKVKSQSVKVYGSSPQKSQAMGFMSRPVGDLEVHVSDSGKFLNTFKMKAAKAGLKENKDYKIKTNPKEKDSPKVYFNFGGKWKKGLEVFSDKSAAPTKDMIGYRPQDGIAFGYTEKPYLKLDDIHAITLQEQGARKFAGATTLRGGGLKPLHSGRTKDIRDLIEIGVGNEVTFKTGIAKDIITYAKLTSEKNKDLLESNVIDFVTRKEKIPTKQQSKVLSSEIFEKPEALLLAKRLESTSRRSLHRSKQSVNKKVTKTVTKPATKTATKKAIRSVASEKTEAIKNLKDLVKHQVAVDSLRHSQVQNKPQKLVTDSRKRQSTGKTSPKQGVTKKFRKDKPKARITEEKELLFSSKSIPLSKKIRTRLSESKARYVKQNSSKAVSNSKAPTKAKAVSSKAILDQNGSSKIVLEKQRFSKKITNSKPATSSKLTPSKTTFSKSIPSKSIPSKSIPSKSIPSKSIPSKSIPSKPTPSKPTPSKPTPSKPTPSKPTPSKPTPSKPTPSKPTSSKPIITSEIIPPEEHRKIILKKRRSESQKAIKNAKDLARFTRKIQNQFGNLDTMFGKSTAKPFKKNVKKAVKRVQRV